MRKYDDPVEVRKGWIDGAGLDGAGLEGPEQFLWRGRLWKVREVVAHWVETGAWWQARDRRAGDLLTEREMWRVEAGRGPASLEGSSGVFDLAFDWAEGRWQLVGCVD